MKKMVFCLVISMVVTSVAIAESRNSTAPRSVSGGSALADRAVANSAAKQARAQSEMRARPGNLADAQGETKKRTKVRRGFSGGSAMVDTNNVGSAR